VILFFRRLPMPRVEIARIASHPHKLWMSQIARQC
jgi:hypothetical protein